MIKHGQTIALVEYKGGIDFTQVNVILNNIKETLHLELKLKPLEKRIYNIAVEVIENIQKHYNISPKERLITDSQYQPLFQIVKEEESIVVLSKNLIYQTDLLKIKTRIDYINQLKEEEVVNFYLQEIEKSEISEKGNAGLGFIDMVKKSKTPLMTDFETVTEHLALFKLEVHINLN